MTIHCTTPTVKDEMGKSGRKGPHMRTSTRSPNLLSRLFFLSLAAYFVNDKLQPCYYHNLMTIKSYDYSQESGMLMYRRQLENPPGKQNALHHSA